MTNLSININKSKSLKKKYLKYILGFFFIVFFCLFLVIWFVIADQIIGFDYYNSINNKDSLKTSMHKGSYELNKYRKTFPPNNNYWFFPGSGMLYATNNTFKKSVYKLNTDTDGAIKTSSGNIGVDGKVLFLGDAVASMVYLKEKNRLPSILEQYFSNLKLDIKVKNFSHPFQTTKESVDVLSYFGQRRKYKYVILFGSTESIYYLRHFGSFYNDYYNSYYLQNDEQDLVFLSAIKARLGKVIVSFASIFAPFITDYIYKKDSLKNYQKSYQDKAIPNIPEFLGHHFIYNIRKERDREEIVKEYENIIKIFINEAHTNSIKPIIVIDELNEIDLKQPSKKDLWIIEYMEKVNDTPYEEFVLLHKAMQGKLRNLCKIMDVTCIETSDLATDEYMYDLRHFNVKGSQEITQRLEKHLSF